MSRTLTHAPQCHNVYPSGVPGEGYASDSLPKYRVREGDERVADLYQRYCKRMTSEVSADMLREITELARELLSLDRLNVALKSATLSDEMRHFLVESLNFTVTGRRTASIEVTGQILDFNEVGSKVRPVVKSIAEPDLHPELRKRARQRALIYNWVNQPNGIKDILCTLHILYVGCL